MKKQKEIKIVFYFLVDKSVQYERLMEVINTTKNSGYNKIALAQEMTEK